MRIVQFAIDAGVSVIAWRHKLDENTSRKLATLSEQQQRRFFDNYPELTSYFVSGAPISHQYQHQSSEGSVVWNERHATLTDAGLW